MRWTDWRWKRSRYRRNDSKTRKTGDSTKKTTGDSKTRKTDDSKTKKTARSMKTTGDSTSDDAHPPPGRRWWRDTPAGLQRARPRASCGLRGRRTR
jgi:hypothetical protein